jgi:hypothetical protein
MKPTSKILSAACASLVALSVALPNAPQVHAKAPTQSIKNENEASVVVRIIAEHPAQCPDDNLRVYTFIYIEGKGVPDANGYIFATARATTDIAILSGPVVSLAPRHHERTYDIAVKLEQFPPVPVPGLTTTHSLDVIGMPKACMA